MIPKTNCVRMIQKGENNLKKNSKKSFNKLIEVN